MPPKGGMIYSNTDDDYVPNKAPEHSAEYESARLQIMIDAVNAPRETWEEFKQKEKAV
jgi:hypothetical protein